MGTFGTLCNVLMFIWRSWCICRNIDSCRRSCCVYVIDLKIPAAGVVTILDHYVVAGVGAWGNQCQYDLDDHGYDIQHQNGDLFTNMWVVDVHADEKGQGLTNKYEVCNDLRGDWSTAECVYSLVFSDHFGVFVT